LKKAKDLVYCFVDVSNSRTGRTHLQLKAAAAFVEKGEELTGLDLEAKIWAEMSRRPRGSEA